MRVRSAGVIGRFLIIVACLLVVACQTTPKSGRSRGPSPTKLAPQQIQVELMAFTDSYTALVSQAADQISDEMPDRRQAILNIKIRNIRNAIIIAAGANPVGALLDMTVMVTLQRQLTEEHWVPEVIGEPGEPLLRALQALEREIWELAYRSLDEEAVDALRELIPEIRARFPDQVHVSAIRASDIAEDRSAMVVEIRGGGSLLGLFQLDPLANLSPASQELAQTRLLAERLFFWIKRAPVMLDWHLEEFMLDAFGQQEVQSLVEASTQLSQASADLSNTAAELSEWWPEERAAAITQALDGIAAEREAIVGTFENEEARLRGLMGDMKTTAESMTALSSTMTETVETTDRFFAGFRREPGAPPPPERRPFDITEYQASAETLTETLREINTLVGSLDVLLASPAWDDRSTQIQTAAAEGEAGLERLIDRLFVRGLIVVLVLVAASLVAMILFRLMFRRAVGPSAPVAR
jgi:hypothetical protein